MQADRKERTFKPVGGMQSDHRDQAQQDKESGTPRSADMEMDRLHSKRRDILSQNTRQRSQVRGSRDHHPWSHSMRANTGRAVAFVQLPSMGKLYDIREPCDARQW
jgi:hypothetical protein